MFNDATDMIHLVDTDGRIIDANQIELEKMGFNREEYIGKSLKEFIHPDYREFSMAAVRKIFAGEPIVGHETIMVRRDGTPISVEVYSTPFVVAGKVAYARSIICDISARKREEAELAEYREELEELVNLRSRELKESEEKYRSLFDLSDDANMTLDREGFIDCNQATLEMFGCASKEEFLGKHLCEISPPFQADGTESRIAADERIATAYQKGKNFFEWICRRVNCDDFPSEILLTKMSLKGKNILQAIVRDITKRKLAEKKLLESEESQRTILETSPDYIFVLDANGTIMRVNRVSPGHRTADVVGQKASMFLASDYKDRFEKAFRRVIRTKHIQTLETMVNLPDGQHYFLTRLNPIQLANEKGLVLHIGTDITERKRAEEELERSLAILNAILESTTDAMLAANRDGKLTNFNTNFIKMWHIPDSIIQSYDDNKVLEYCLTQFKNPQTFISKVRYLHSKPEESSFDILELLDGRIVEHYSQPQWVGKKVVGRVCNFRDITERKAAEDELRQSKEGLARAQKIAHVGSWTWDLVSNETIWSDELFRILGFEPNEVKPSLDLWFEMIHPSDVEIVEKLVAKARQGVIEVSAEYRMVIKDKSIRFIFAKGYNQFDEKNNPVEMYGIVQDITESKQAELSLIDARNEAESANKAKSKFLSSMSHELRTPMNAILGYGQLLESNPKEPLTETQKKCVNHILKGGAHLLDLINDLLDLAKIDAGKVELIIEDVQAAEIIDGCLSLVSPLAEERNIDLTIPDTSEVASLIRADRTRFKQVLLNLISNAIKYNHKGGNVIIFCQETADNMLRVSLTDTGKGIPKNKQREIFQPFSRLGAEHTEIEGTGIGLVVCKNLLELMEGRIGFESRVGKGSTFWIELPLVLKKATVAEATKGATTETMKRMPEIRSNT